MLSVSLGKAVGYIDGLDDCTNKLMKLPKSKTGLKNRWKFKLKNVLTKVLRHCSFTQMASPPHNREGEIC